MIGPALLFIMQRAIKYFVWGMNTVYAAAALQLHDIYKANSRTTYYQSKYWLSVLLGCVYKCMCGRTEYINISCV